MQLRIASNGGHEAQWLFAVALNAVVTTG